MVRNRFRPGALLLLTAICLAPLAAQAQTVPLFSTGVDAIGAPMNGGDRDDHYTFVQDFARGFVLNNQTPGPYVQSPTSRWIWANAAGTGSGIFDCFTTFTLTAQEVASGISLSGRWATDNTGSLLLNGVAQSSAFNSPDFTAWTPFSITNGFTVGTNTLTFRVTNLNDFAAVGGLNVDQVQYVVGAGASAPEPGTLVLLALGSLPVALLRRRQCA